MLFYVRNSVLNIQWGTPIILVIPNPFSITFTSLLMARTLFQRSWYDFRGILQSRVYSYFIDYQELYVQPVLTFKNCTYSYWLRSSYEFSEQTATFALYNINSLIFITEVGSVYSAVRTDSLHNTDNFLISRVNFVFWTITRVILL